MNMNTSDWTSAYRHKYNFQQYDDGTVALQFPNRGGTLDLKDIPDNIQVQVTTTPTKGPQHVNLKNAREGHCIHIQQPITVSLVDRLESVGTIIFAYDGQAGEAIFKGRARYLYVLGRTAYVSEATVETAVLQENGKLSGNIESVEVVQIYGEATLPQGARNLRIAGSSTVVRLTGQPHLATLSVDQENASHRLVSARNGGTTIRVTDFLTKCNSPIDLENISLSVEQIEGPLRLEGKGHLYLTSDNTVTSLTLGDSVTLSAAEGAAVIRLRGYLLVAHCTGVTLRSASNESYTFLGFRKGAPSPSLEGATLRGISMTDNSSGRRRIHDLRQAAVVEPHIGGMRVRKLGWRLPFARTYFSRSDTKSRELEEAAFFAQELASLINEKCGLGSLRTKVNWAAYRGRHLIASSRWEAAALGVFRLVGYGHRPAPPAALWVGLAFAFAFFSDKTIIGSFVTLVSSPLFLLLRLAGDPQLGNLNELEMLPIMLMRTAVTIPFAFFVIATARFLRADWPW